MDLPARGDHVPGRKHEEAHGDAGQNASKKEEDQGAGEQS